ncbi:hypothetical protein J4212_02980 [Candidatus Woesearchaeota archaeon]|nr:hypothetical protein [Candidatus Woesearchaeota archaeon]
MAALLEHYSIPAEMAGELSDRLEPIGFFYEGPGRDQIYNERGLMALPASIASYADFEGRESARPKNFAYNQKFVNLLLGIKLVAVKTSLNPDMPNWVCTNFVRYEIYRIKPPKPKPH